MSTVGNRIHDRRISLGISADELASYLGKSRATIYRYESDEIEKFPVSIIIPLAKALKISPAYLMGWVDEDGAVDLGLATLELNKEHGVPFDKAEQMAESMAEAPALQELSEDEEKLLHSFRQMDIPGQQSFLLLAQNYVPARADFQKAQALLSDPVKQGFHSESASQGR